MANTRRQFYNSFFSLEADPIIVFAVVGIGATGAPTLDALKSKGVESIVRNSAGDYTITLGQNYRRLLQVHATVKHTSAPSSVGFFLKADTVATDGKIGIVFVDAAGAAVELTEDASVLLDAWVQRTSVGN